jgi:hypothetical protein
MTVCCNASECTIYSGGVKQKMAQRTSTINFDHGPRVTRRNFLSKHTRMTVDVELKDWPKPEGTPHIKIQCVAQSGHVQNKLVYEAA